MSVRTPNRRDYDVPLSRSLRPHLFLLLKGDKQDKGKGKGVAVVRGVGFLFGRDSSVCDTATRNGRAGINKER